MAGNGGAAPSLEVAPSPEKGTNMNRFESMNEPIRVTEVVRMRAQVATISRDEAQRQFRMSLALVSILSMASLATTVVTLGQLG